VTEQHPRVRVLRTLEDLTDEQAAAPSRLPGWNKIVMPVALPDRLAVQQAQGACMPIHEWGTPGAREVALAFNLLLARVLRVSRSRRRAVHRDFDDEEIQEAVDA
jgi:hypothetical protein